MRERREKCILNKIYIGNKCRMILTQFKCGISGGYFFLELKLLQLSLFLVCQGMCLKIDTNEIESMRINETLIAETVLCVVNKGGETRDAFGVKSSQAHLQPNREFDSANSYLVPTYIDFGVIITNF